MGLKQNLENLKSNQPFELPPNSLASRVLGIDLQQTNGPSDFIGKVNQVKRDSRSKDDLDSLRYSYDKELVRPSIYEDGDWSSEFLLFYHLFYGNEGFLEVNSVSASEKSELDIGILSGFENHLKVLSNRHLLLNICLLLEEAREPVTETLGRFCRFEFAVQRRFPQVCENIVLATIRLGLATAEDWQEVGQSVPEDFHPNFGGYFYEWISRKPNYRKLKKTHSKLADISVDVPGYEPRVSREELRSMILDMSRAIEQDPTSIAQSSNLLDLLKYATALQEIHGEGYVDEELEYLVTWATGSIWIAHGPDLGMLPELIRQMLKNPKIKDKALKFVDNIVKNDELNLQAMIAAPFIRGDSVPIAGASIKLYLDYLRYKYKSKIDTKAVAQGIINTAMPSDSGHFLNMLRLPVIPWMLTALVYEFKLNEKALLEIVTPIARELLSTPDVTKEIEMNMGTYGIQAFVEKLCVDFNFLRILGKDALTELILRKLPKNQRVVQKLAIEMDGQEKDYVKIKTDIVERRSRSLLPGSWKIRLAGLNKFRFDAKMVEGETGQFIFNVRVLHKGLHFKYDFRFDGTNIEIDGSTPSTKQTLRKLTLLILDHVFVPAENNPSAPTIPDNEIQPSSPTPTEKPTVTVELGETNERQLSKPGLEGLTVDLRSDSGSEENRKKVTRRIVKVSNTQIRRLLQGQEITEEEIRNLLIYEMSTNVFIRVPFERVKDHIQNGTLFDSANEYYLLKGIPHKKSVRYFRREHSEPINWHEMFKGVASDDAIEARELHDEFSHLPPVGDLTPTRAMLTTVIEAEFSEEDGERIPVDHVAKLYTSLRDPEFVRSYFEARIEAVYDDMNDVFYSDLEDDEKWTELIEMRKQIDEFMQTANKFISSTGIARQESIEGIQYSVRLPLANQVEANRTFVQGGFTKLEDIKRDFDNSLASQEA